jgi:hypothetical protein
MISGATAVAILAHVAHVHVEHYIELSARSGGAAVPWLALRVTTTFIRETPARHVHTSGFVQAAVVGSNFATHSRATRMQR